MNLNECNIILMLLDVKVLWYKIFVSLLAALDHTIL